MVLSRHSGFWLYNWPPLKKVTNARLCYTSINQSSLFLNSRSVILKFGGLSRGNVELYNRGQICPLSNLLLSHWTSFVNLHNFPGFPLNILVKFDWDKYCAPKRQLYVWWNYVNSYNFYILWFYFVVSWMASHDVPQQN